MDLPFMFSPFFSIKLMKVHKSITRKSFFTKLGAVVGSFGLFGFIGSSNYSVGKNRINGTNAKLLARFKLPSGSVKSKTLS
tara:strand:- start:2339 stop:2581 length:243 start_codon:yes stop_codon:yes gene_type:complete